MGLYKPNGRLCTETKLILTVTEMKPDFLKIEPPAINLPLYTAEDHPECLLTLDGICLNSCHFE